VKFDFNKLMEHLPAPIRREKKKAAALGLLMTAGAVIGVSQFWPHKVATARAKVATNSEDPAVDSSKKTKPESMEAARLQLLNKWLETAAKAPLRNVFAVDYGRYPLTSREAAERASELTSETIWDRIAKSESQRADEIEQRRIRQSQLLAAVSRMKLQTTLIKPGAASAAMVDGRLVKIGEKVSVDGDGLTFTVVSIDGRQMIVEREGVKIAIALDKEAVLVQ